MEVGEGVSANFYVRSRGAAQGLKSPGEGHLIKKLAETLQSGDCVYDVGAGIGLYTLLLAGVVGQRGLVVAFEPSTLIYNYLQDHLKLNGLTNVRAFRVALGDRDRLGKLELVAAPRLLQTASTKRTRAPVQSVEIVEGDLLVRRKNLRLPRAVKIDVEGYEYAVICGLRHTLAQDVCETVLCEIHPHLLPADITKKDVVDLLQSLGFCRIEICRCRPRVYHALCYKT